MSRDLISILDLPSPVWFGWFGHF